VTPALGDSEQTALDVRRAVLPVTVKVGGRRGAGAVRRPAARRCVRLSGKLPVPEGATGDAASLELQAGGHSSNTVTVTVR